MREDGVLVAAVGDADVYPRLRAMFDRLARHADLLLLAGDLTCIGAEAETAAVAAAVEDLPVPVVAVLGNHDHHAGRPHAVRARLEACGVRVLEGEA